MLSRDRCAHMLGWLVLSSGCAVAQPEIDIPPGELPDESFFAANPGAIVHVGAGGVILPGELGDPFGFNGATVNIGAGGASGWVTVDHFVEDVTYNLDGGELFRARFVGGSSATTLNVLTGSVERGLWLSGDTVANIFGGTIGVVAGGLPAFTAEDDADVTMSGGTVDAAVLVRDSAALAMSGGTVLGTLVVEDDASVTLSGGTIAGIDGRVVDAGSVLNVTGGTITGSAFVVERGTINMSAGGIGDNAGMVTGGAIGPMVNMTGGALGTGFRAYDGTITISGGVVGDEFRLGTPTGDGSGVTCNLIVKSATLDAVPIVLSRLTATEITVRGGAFLSAVLLDDAVLGFDLNETSVAGEDRIRAGATLTVMLGPCAADIDGDGVLNNADINTFVGVFTAGDDAGDVNGDGVLNNTDINEFVAAFLAGCD